MTYQDALNYLESFTNYEKVEKYDYKASLKLERMKRFASLLDDPQKNIPSIHIAGSKGKGSTAAYTYSILKSAGFKTGLYTSPHLVSFRERIRIDNELISEEDLSRILGDIREVVESSMKDEKPTFFEVYTALAYLYFKEKKVDYAVYEVGLGGRLDATNLIEPLACAITPISYEHTDKLGNTLREIATEKCGIIKRGVTCVSAPQTEEALRAIEGICKDRSARLILVGRDISFEEVSSGEEWEVFNVRGIAGVYRALRSKLIGSHQMMNAALAIGLIESLASKGIVVDKDAVRKGVEGARWEGRLEVLHKRPLVITDGAQNRASAHALAQTVKKVYKYKKLILVFGVSNDKDVRGMLEELLPLCDKAVLTKSKVVARALEPFKIKEAMSSVEHGVKDIILTGSVEEAFDKAVSAAAIDDMILITGSLFVVGEVKEAIKGCVKIA